MKYPYITFVQTSEGERTLVLTFETKQESLELYEKLTPHNFCWYNHPAAGVVISLKVSDGSFLTEKLMNPIDLYKNNRWFTNNELTHITTDFYGSHASERNPPITLFQQIPCP